MNRRKVIALLLNSEGLRDDYQGGLRRGVEQACVEHDVDLWVYAIHAGRSPQQVRIRRLLGILGPDRIAGAIVAAGCIATWTETRHVVDHLRSSGVPSICCIGQTFSHVPTMLVDNRGGSSTLVDHLCEEHGRRQFVYVGGPAGHEESDQRIAGVVESLERHGIQLDASRVYYGDWTADSGNAAVREFLHRQIQFDAALAANDEMALGIITALPAAGLRCPKDVSVVGFDDTAAARFSQPPLTTSSQPLMRLGMLAVKRIIDSWSYDLPEDPLVLDTELILRESCGCHPTLHVRARGGKDEWESEHRRPHEEIRELLRPIFYTERERDRYAWELVEATALEVRRQGGTLSRVLNGMILRIQQPNVPLYELQRIVTCLRDSVPPEDVGPELEGAFHSARVLVGSHAYRREGRMRLRNESLLADLRFGWERLATCLSLSELRQALATELPRVGIHNATIALYPASEESRLIPLLCIKDGVAQSIPEVEYPAAQLIPDLVLDGEDRLSFTVLPLTFESEYLGVAVLDMPPGLDVYALLREQIGSAVKTAAMHQEILKKERLHAQAQEDKRVAKERLRSLSLIAGGVAHDLNNALGPLVALPEAIQRDLETTAGLSVPQEVMADLEMIHTAGQRAALTIRDLMALGKPTPVPQSALDLNQALLQERSTLSACCKRDGRIGVTVEVWKEPLPVLIDKTHLMRAVMNLTINAADAIVDGGSIVVRSRHARVESRIDGVEPVDPGVYAVIDVIDTGHGVSAQHLPRILEPFFTARQRSDSIGTGLGLAIVHRIVSDAKGYLNVKSELGRGTTVSLYFPLQASVEYPEAQQPMPVVGGREQILVVDDEPVQLRTARRILEQLGYIVFTVRSGREAVEAVQAQPDNLGFDLVIVDMVMPGGLNGMQTIEQIRSFRRDQRVLIASGYAPEQMDVLAAERGLPWLPKPYTRAKLAAAVRATLVRACPQQDGDASSDTLGSRSNRMGVERIERGTLPAD